MDEQMSLFAPALPCGRTSPEPFPVTKAGTSKPSCQSLSESRSQTPLMCLCLTRDAGPTPDFSWETDGALLGDCWTPNIGEYPRDARESRLSQILEDNAPEKYYLSARALKGIKTRAERRQKQLPPVLEAAIDFQIAWMEQEPPEHIRQLYEQFQTVWMASR